MFDCTPLFSSTEPPVSIVRKLENQKVPDGAVISVECELSRHNVDVKWMKASYCFAFFLDLSTVIILINASS